jgi:hypothetical protein
MTTTNTGTQHRLLLAAIACAAGKIVQAALEARVAQLMEMGYSRN